MNKKVSLGVMISLIAVACAITFVLTMTVSLNMYNSMVAGIQERETINAKIKEIDTFVRSSSIYKPNENTLITVSQTAISAERATNTQNITRQMSITSCNSYKAA